MKAATAPILKELDDATSREDFPLDRMKWLDGQHELMELRKLAEQGREWAEAVDEAAKDDLSGLPPLGDVPEVSVELAGSASETCEQDPPWVPPSGSRETDAKNSFGRQLRQLRLSLGLSQAAMGEIIGCTGPHVGNMERGLRTCERVVFQKVEAYKKRKEPVAPPKGEVEEPIRMDAHPNPPEPKSVRYVGKLGEYVRAEQLERAAKEAA